MIKDTGRQGYAFREDLLNWLFLSKSDVKYPKNGLWSRQYFNSDSEKRLSRRVKISE